MRPTGSGRAAVAAWLALAAGVSAPAAIAQAPADVPLAPAVDPAAAVVAPVDVAPAPAVDPAPAPVAEAPPAPAAVPAPPSDRVIAPGTPFTDGALLSDERLLTRWAYPGTEAVVYAAPSLSAARIGRLHFHTEDGYRELYVVLRAAVDARSGQWVQVRLPRRPNGAIGWVVRGALGDFQVVDTQLTINRSTQTAVLYRAGKAIWHSRVGVGKPGTPTPAGHFYVRERIRVAQSKTLYGPYAFGTSAYSRLSEWPRGGVVGIHGTNQPKLIPGRPSHGCVRVPNAAISRLAPLLTIGTPVLIT